MAQDNIDRLAQVEALLLQLAESSVRHDNQMTRSAERMDRIEANIAENARLIAANAQAIASMRESHDQLISESVEWFGEVFTRIDEMQSEVRGLQTENRRILERLEQHMGNGHGG